MSNTTVRYILFVNRQIAPGEIVLVPANGVSIFRTNFPDVPPGHEAAGPGERWSRVVISHNMTVDALACYEHAYWRMGEFRVEVINGHNFTED